MAGHVETLAATLECAIQQLRELAWAQLTNNGKHSQLRGFAVAKSDVPQTVEPFENPRQHWGNQAKKTNRERLVFLHMVERRRIELPTSALRTRRSPS